jgi:catechol 2,3-dioxygenase-like lactoylglutathione lyase family enzyme
MLNGSTAFSGYSTNDLAAATTFYRDTLGLDASETDEGGLSLRFRGGHRVFIYAKDDHQPATFTVLNIEVADIDAVVDGLTAAGVTFERYGDEFGQDERGIARGEYGPPIAWFTDPAGNIIAIIESSGDRI